MNVNPLPQCFIMAEECVMPNSIKISLAYSTCHRTRGCVHPAGVTHRDIKPLTFIVTPNVNLESPIKLIWCVFRRSEETRVLCDWMASEKFNQLIVITRASGGEKVNK